MTTPNTEQRGHEERRWSRDRRSHERRQGWQFDRRRRHQPILVERRGGSDRRLQTDRRRGTDRRARVVNLCESTVGAGETCSREAVLKSSATGAWYCVEHLALDLAPDN